MEILETAWSALENTVSPASCVPRSLACVEATGINSFKAQRFGGHGLRMQNLRKTLNNLSHLHLPS
jgi:hypothetical protein